MTRTVLQEDFLRLLQNAFLPFFLCTRRTLRAEISEMFAVIVCDSIKSFRGGNQEDEPRNEDKGTKKLSSARICYLYAVTAKFFAID